MCKFCWTAIIVCVTVLNNGWLILKIILLVVFSTTEIAIYHEVILNVIWFLFTKISAWLVWRKKGKRYNRLCACNKVEYEGGGKLHSFLTLALDGEVSEYLNTLVATKPAKQRLVLTEWATEPACWTTLNVRLLKIQVFWDVILCWWENRCQHFELYSPHLQHDVRTSRTIHWATQQHIPPEDPNLQFVYKKGLLRLS
jgi:hypothetical protein